MNIDPHNDQAYLDHCYRQWQYYWKEKRKPMIAMLFHKQALIYKRSLGI